MKKVFLIVMSFLWWVNLSAQMGINTDSSTPDQSAMLDIKSTDKGVLIPRLTTSQRNGISNPATGLLVFDAEMQGFWFYNGSMWQDLSLDADTDSSNELQNIEEVLSTGNDANQQDITNLNRISIDSIKIGPGLNDDFWPFPIDPTSLDVDGKIRMREGAYPGRMLVSDWFGTMTWTDAEDLLPRYNVGDFAQGGVVFWVDETGQHGLVADIVDLSGGQRWTDAEVLLNTYTRNAGKMAGEKNTLKIVLDDFDTTTAAKLCYTLDKGGYGDWYLPSIEELNLMFWNRYEINATSIANGGTAMASGFVSYWSSTEHSQFRAMAKGFGLTGTVFNDYKTKNYKVRAVRSF